MYITKISVIICSVTADIFLKVTPISHDALLYFFAGIVLVQEFYCVSDKTNKFCQIIKEMDKNKSCNEFLDILNKFALLCICVFVFVVYCVVNKMF